jgi:hypothetical protein
MRLAEERAETKEETTSPRERSKQVAALLHTPRRDSTE